MLLDHMLIRRDADQLANAPPLELLHDLGARLAAHVELEERELFPLIEQTIPEPELDALGDRLRNAAH
jgi:hemerythrin-like domain-containing protein